MSVPAADLRGSLALAGRGSQAGNARAMLLAVLLALVPASAARAEATLVVDLLDMARDGDQAAALLGVISIDLDESQAAGGMVQSGVCPGPVPQDINTEEPCYAAVLRDSHLQISDLRSQVLVQLGNTDYLLLRWRTTPVGNTPVQPGGHFFQVTVGYNGFYNGNQGEFFDLSRLPGELDPDQPYSFLRQYYDDRLNQLYRRTLASPALRAEDADALRRAQREWLKKTESQCGTARDQGSADEQAQARCVAERSAQRVWEIKKLRLQWGLARDLT
ncbi:lysozyme inhibitor LprI family protein [Achromobacter xylosoxidans]|uniref:Lysozyme inhibitor LprI-like N-terminal domain-containing protein n=1 Tax=Alcaligenes xylosoxydans xylosoxydans TaxID=85698 RepID=A0A1R1JVU2_ALCXX|nr:lysozyme inhibitor LprI family protein [Achromobacter xylosoxidans]OMG89764.1 hypothetical protein BIZ92_23420 [Achromobacter xylosoxidans]BEG73097.1 hypothetical protein HBIAX_00138 [Achromobacter xylosoxidans]